MSNEKLHSLILLEDFKAILGVDDRDNALSRFCLITATWTIEQYCGRRLLCKKVTDYLTFTGGYEFTLREYPVRRVIGVMANGNPIDPAVYRLIPEFGLMDEIPVTLSFKEGLRLPCREGAIRVRYAAGYMPGRVPADLGSACLELAAWNFSRYKGRKIGIVGNVVRAKGTEGEHLETSMPEQVRLLLEPYKRRCI
jgi:hypothetical protein